MRTLITLGLIGVAGYFGFTYLIRQRKLLEETDIRIKGVKVDKISISAVKLRLILEVVNKSNLKLTVKNQSYSAYIDGRYIASSHKPDNVILLPNTATSTDLLIEFNPLQLISQVYGAAAELNWRNLTLTIRGKLTVVSSLVVVNQLPVNFEVKFGDIV